MKRSGFLPRSAPMKQSGINPKAEPKMRIRKCAVKECRAPFAPRSMTHKTCSAACAERHVAVEKARQHRKERQEGLAKLKRRADYIKETQTAFNAWVRFRDREQSCICCGRTSDVESRGGTWDAGHYRSRGSAPHLRFDERNCHAQLKNCNRYGAGRAVDYRIGLIVRIGLQAVEALECDQAPRDYTIDDLKALKAHYVAKLKQLKGMTT